MNVIERPKKKDARRTMPTIKFYPMGASGKTTYLYFSTPLQQLIRDSKMKNVTFGLLPETNYLVMEFNNKTDGLSLVNKYNEYRAAAIGANLLFDKAVEQISVLSKNKMYQVSKVEEHTFLIHIEDEAYLNEVDMEEAKLYYAKSKSTIEWFKHIVSPVKNKHSVKFYMKKSISPTLYVSKKLKEAACANGMEYLKVGIDKEAEAFIIQFTNNPLDTGIVKGSKRTNLIGAKAIYVSLKACLPNLKSETVYLGREIDAVTYEFSIASPSIVQGSVQKADLKDVVWLDLEPDLEK